MTLQKPLKIKLTNICALAAEVGLFGCRLMIPLAKQECLRKYRKREMIEAFFESMKRCADSSSGFWINKGE